MTTRPVQLLGMCPDGVHRFLYTHSRDGSLYMNPRMFALEYGLTYGRFAILCKELIDDRRLVPTGPNRSMLKSFWVAEPEHYDYNDERFGQVIQDRGYVRPLTPEEMSDAVDLYEQLEDMLDEAGLDELYDRYEASQA